MRSSTPHAAPRPDRPRRRAGFTLIELLAVILILAILMAFLITALGGQGDAVRANLTRTKIEQFAAEISAYESAHGRYPTSSWKEEWGTLPNQINVGIEALVVQLWSAERGGTHLSEDDLVNTDGDSSSRKLTVFPRPELFELSDAWGNPLAYIERMDYGRPFVYFTESPVTGEQLETSVQAVENERTGGYHNPRSFQLLSAGPDGEFGTSDDIGNFRGER